MNSHGLKQRHQLVAASLAAAAVTLPAADAAAAPPKIVKKVVSRSFTGAAAEADRWGPLQVTAIVAATTTTTTRTVKGKKKTTRKVTRRITGIRVPTYPNHTDRSVYINQQALPLLVQEVLQAQSPNVNLISRATDTSDAFLSSLRSALAQVK